MARDKYLEKFIDSKFSELHGRLDKMESNNKDRDDTVERMDAENKKRLDALEKDVGFVKSLVKGIGALLTAAATAAGLWKAVH